MRLLGLVISLCLALALPLAGCGDGDSTDGTSTAGAGTGGTAGAPSSTAASGGEGASAPPARQVGAAGEEPEIEAPQGAPPDELETEDLVEGDGAVAEAGDEVTVHYVGADYATGEQFDSSWQRREPFRFELGSGLTVPGFESGIEGMRVGGRRELIIPPLLAYGEEGSPPTIAPESTLIFVVDLLEVG